MKNDNKSIKKECGMDVQQCKDSLDLYFGGGVRRVRMVLRFTITYASNAYHH